MIEGTPCAVKVARTVWSGGKARDNIKGLGSVKNFVSMGKNTSFLVRISI